MPEPAHGLTYALRQRSDSIEHISALKKTCKSMARYFQENSVTSFSRPTPINSDEAFFINMGGRVMFIEPIATYKSQVKGKTYGFIRFEGGEVKFKAESGWGPRTRHDDSLRDNEFLSSQVLQFCNYLGYRLPGHCWDKTEIGQYAACHVEKKLILMLICDIIYDVETGDIAMFRLDELWERKLRAQIYLDKDPCNGCRKFALELGNATGIHFRFITAKNVVEAELAKKNGKKQLQPKRTAQTVHSQLFDYSTPRTRPSKPVDYSIPKISTSQKSASRGKRKRTLDDYDGDDDDDETFVPKELQSKAKRLYQEPRKVEKIGITKDKPINYRLGRPTATYEALKNPFTNTPHSWLSQQKNTKADMKSAKTVSPLSFTKNTKASASRSGIMGQDSAAISSGKLPNGQAVPSERSRAIAEFQKAQMSSLARPVKPNLSIFHCVQSLSSISRKETCTTLSDTDSTSSSRSRTVSPEGYPATPTSRTVKIIPTLGTTPSRRYTESSYSERFSAEESMTPSKSFRNSCKRAPTKSLEGLFSEQFPTQEPITPPRSVQKTYKRIRTNYKPAKDVYSETFSAHPTAHSRSVENTYKQTPMRHAVAGSRHSKQNNSRSIDLTTPEPSPFSKIQQFQYTPPSKSNKRREEKKALPVPFQLSYKNN
ncbi:hypothetical protein EYC80_008907 [Monilinia laxa]|nr:hypothetical protein EYC80_008907 [Monilinia laxa]